MAAPEPPHPSGSRMFPTSADQMVPNSGRPEFGGEREGRRLDVAQALKSATVAAVIAIGLFGLLIGFRTDQGAGGALGITPRPDPLVIVVAVVFVGRFLLVLLWAARGDVVRLAPPIPAWVKPVLTRIGEWFGPALLGFALITPIIFYDNRYLLDLGIMVLTYVMLGWGLNIVVGLAGLLDLGYVAFYAVGAYSYALLALYFGWSFWICLPLAGILAAFWGILLGFPVLRLRGDYLAIVTLAFGEIIRIVLINWQSFTGGPNGVSAPRPSFFGIPFTAGDDGFAATFGLEFSATHRVVFLFYLILALALITNWVTIRLRRLPVGRAWEAMREDEIACRSLGINTTNTKLTAFAIGAMFGGFAGAFFATRQGFISPESFVFMESATILAIVVLGGMGSQLGVAIAAVVMLGGFEFFREFAQFRMLIFGAAMVAIMVWRPRGLIATREPSIFLKERKIVSAELVEEARK
ncbi:MAG: high-affinity branched-chain amino acid ABC transporter permease LivM [Rhizobiales bacterium]|nr:high-affinity branched-chain amino acid ABC transporter permease LivM [Hyphomicrobiales bacterium]